MGGRPAGEPEGHQVVARQDDFDTAQDLVTRVYDTLRGIAGQLMSHERPGHTLQPTAVVHEAFARLTRIDRIDWQDEAHFCAMAAREMRRVLIDHARQRGSQKRWGQAVRISLPENLTSPAIDADELLIFDEALDALAKRYPRQARVAELRVFCGLPSGEIARVLDVCRNTVSADWSFASAWLRRRLRKTTGGS